MNHPAPEQNKENTQILFENLVRQHCPYVFSAPEEERRSRFQNVLDLLCNRLPFTNDFRVAEDIVIKEKRGHRTVFRMPVHLGTIPFLLNEKELWQIHRRFDLHGAIFGKFIVADRLDGSSVPIEVTMEKMFNSALANGASISQLAPIVEKFAKAGNKNFFKSLGRRMGTATATEKTYFPFDLTETRIIDLWRRVPEEESLGLADFTDESAFAYLMAKSVLSASSSLTGYRTTVRRNLWLSSAVPSTVIGVKVEKARVEFVRL